jgi:hypothetical protein
LIHNPSAFFRTRNVEESWQCPQNERSGDTCKIVPWRPWRKPCGGKNRCHGADLVPAEFHRQNAIRCEQAGGMSGNFTISVEPVQPAI